MFEIKHLKTLSTLATAGNIRKAADELFTSQSALSHQIKDLEQRLGASLFIRNTAPIEFTVQGRILLTLAETILPKIHTALSDLTGEQNNEEKLNLAIACHACFQWLLPVTEQFSHQHPTLKIEFMEQFFPQQLDNQAAEKIDVLFTDEKIDNDNYMYQTLGKFEVVGVLAKQNNLTKKSFLSAADFSQQVLLTYPVKTEQLDLFRLFLNKTANKHQPKTIKQVESSYMILQMVAANMGIATLPDWLVNSVTKQSLVQTKRIGERGIFKTLYLRYEAQNKHVDIIKQLIPQTVAAFSNLYQT